MDYIQVKNWETFQHYNDRTPPWIKLYNHLLDDFEFSCLPDASKAHLLSIWLLASRTNNKIPNNEKWISNKINATDKVDLKLLLNTGFIELIQSENNSLGECNQDASKELQTSEQSACLEREKRERREREKDNDLFSEFWALYKKSSDKKKCEDKFKKLSKADVEKIFKVLPSYIASTPEVKFRKNPLTWLNGRCWEDEIDSVKENKPEPNSIFNQNDDEARQAQLDKEIQSLMDFVPYGH